MRRKFAAATNQFVTVSACSNKLSAGKIGEGHAGPCPNQPILPAPGGRNFRPSAAFLETRRDGGDGAGRIRRRSGRIHHFVGIGIDLGTTMTSISTSYKRSGWPDHLTRPVQVKNGPTLRALDDLRAYILSGPKAVRERKLWQCACSFCWPPPNVTATSCSDGEDRAGAVPRGKVGADAQFAPSRISYQRRVRQKGTRGRVRFDDLGNWCLPWGSAVSSDTVWRAQGRA